MKPSRMLPRCLLPLLLGACGGPAPDGAGPAPGSGPADRLLCIDGIDIGLGEVEQHVRLLDEIGPEWSRRTKIRRVLDEFTIPLRLAQRTFPERRRQLLELARNLREVAANAIELEAKGAQFLHERKRVTRRSVELPVARFLFDEQTTGAVSDPIEVPRGFIVAAAFDLVPAALVIDDQADAVQVGFLSHSTGDWATWLDVEKRRVAGKVTYVHPDHREAMPEWIVLP
ncbi:MAG: hypothetical protein FJ265_04135 [Planctomycetes bacterium]|nr:hypothetical protein [Planctomycetota bacterium]